MEDLISKVKKLRYDLSEKIEMIKALPSSRSQALARTKAEEGYMFLGKVLEHLGEPNPYPKESNKASATISDYFEGNVVLPGPDYSIEVVKGVRALLQVIISSGVWNELFDSTTMKGQPFVRYNSLGWQYTSHALLCIVGSKMWLGMVLNEIMTLGGTKEAKEAIGGKEEDLSGPGNKESAFSDHIGGKMDDKAVVNEEETKEIPAGDKQEEGAEGKNQALEEAIKAGEPGSEDLAGDNGDRYMDAGTGTAPGDPVIRKGKGKGKAK